MDWYRRKTWTGKDEEEFFAKLARARKDNRAQYLKIQAIELVETNDKELANDAEKLLNQMLSDFPEDKFNRAGALQTLGDIYKLRGNYDTAIEYYQQAIDFEKVYPQVQTNSFLDFSELVVKTGKTKYYGFVEALLEEKLPEQLFPVAKYKMYSILSIISSYKGDVNKADEYANLAEANASEETSGLQNHKYLGVVRERVGWLDRLVKRK